MKRIVISEPAKANIRAIPQKMAMQILKAIQRLAQTGDGHVKQLKGKTGEKRLRVGDYRVRFTEESQPQTENGANEQTEVVLFIHSVRHRREAYR